MPYKQILVDKLINKIISKDNLFGGNYTVDPYQNCEFACAYCDSSFDPVIYVKTNAAKTLENELRNLPKGRIIVGSVHDPYQKAEEEYKLTRDVLTTINKNGFSCHVLTKSDLILRDIDILNKIKDCYVTVSITSLSLNVSNIFEKNVPKPDKRLDIIKKLSTTGIKTGLAIIPILPFITDKELEDIIDKAKLSNSQYVLFKQLELKGDQKNIFFDIIKEKYPHLVSDYSNLYKNQFFPKEEYISNISQKIATISKEYNLKNSIF